MKQNLKSSFKKCINKTNFAAMLILLPGFVSATNYTCSGTNSLSPAFGTFPNQALQINPGDTLTVNSGATMQTTSGAATSTVFASGTLFSSASTITITVQSTGLLSYAGSTLTANTLDLNIGGNGSYSYNIINNGTINKGSGGGAILIRNTFFGNVVATIANTGSIVGNLTLLSNTVLNMDTTSAAINGNISNGQQMNLGSSSAVAYTTQGTIDSMQNIELFNGTFTVGSGFAITNLSTAFNIDSGTTARLNAAVSGTAATTNNGTLFIGSTGALNTTGTFTNANNLNIASTFTTGTYSSFVNTGGKLYLIGSGGITGNLTTGASLNVGQDSTGAANACNYTLNGTIAGIPIIQVFNGSLTNSGVNTISGVNTSFTVNAGTSATLGAQVSGTGTVTNNGTITISTANALNTSGALTNNNIITMTASWAPNTGASGFNLASAGILNINGGTFTKPTAFTYAGTINLNSTGAMSGVTTGNGSSAVLNIGPVTSNTFTTSASLSGINTYRVYQGSFTATTGNTVTGVNTSFTVDLGAAATFNSTFSGTGTVTNNGTLTLNTGSSLASFTTFTNNKTMQINATANGIAITNNSALTIAGNVTGAGSITNNNSAAVLTLSSGTVNNSIVNTLGNFNVTGVATTTSISNAATTTISAALHNTGSITNTSSFSASALLTNDTNFTNTGGSVSLTAGLTNGGFISNSGTFAVSGGTLNCTGTITNTGTSFTSGGAVVGHGITNSSGTMNLSSTVNNTGNISNSGAFTVGGALTNSGSINSNGTSFTANDTVSASGITNTIGTMNLNSSVNNTGNISNFSIFSVTGALTNSGSITNNGTSFTASGTVSANGISNTSGTMTLSNNVTDTGALSNSGTAFTAGGTLSATSITNSSGTMTLNNTVTNTGNLINNGTLILNATLNNSGSFTTTNAFTMAGNISMPGQTLTASGTTTVSGTRTLTAANYNNSGTMYFTITDPSTNTYDSLTCTGCAINLSSGVVDITNNFAGQLGQTVTLTILSGASLNPPSTSNIVLHNSHPLTRMTASTNSTSIIVTMQLASLEVYAYPGINQKIAVVLDEMAVSPNLTAAQAALLDAMFSSPNTAALNYNLHKLLPDFNSVDANMTVQDDTFRKIEQRVASIRDGFVSPSTDTYIAGDLDYTRSMWISGFGGYTKQLSIDDNDGYRANSAGGLLGFDATVGCDNVFGFAVGISDSNINELSNPSFYTKTFRYHALIYGSHNTFQSTFVDWVLSGSTNNNRGSRLVFIDNIDMSTTSNYNSTLLAGKGTVSTSYDLGPSIRFTPLTSLQFTNINQAAYNEGGGLAALHVNEQAESIFTFGVGGRFNFPVDEWPCQGMREFRFLLSYDATIGSNDTTASFLVGSNSYTIANPWSKLALTMGVGYTYELTHNYQIQANYDLQIRKRFLDQVGMIKFKYLF